MVAYKSSVILLVALLTIGPWGIALFIQKAENRNRSKSLHIKTTGLYVLLFGLTPKKEYIYIGPGLIQIFSLVYLVVCLVAASLWGIDSIIKVTLYIYGGGVVILAILGWIIIMLKQK